MYCNVADLSFWSQLIPAGQTNKQENLYNTLIGNQLMKNLDFLSITLLKEKEYCLCSILPRASLHYQITKRLYYLQSTAGREAGVDGLSETTKYSFRPFGEGVFANFHDKTIVFCGCVKQAVFGCNHIDAVRGQSYIGPYRIVCGVLLVAFIESFSKAWWPLLWTLQKAFQKSHR